MSAAAQWFNEQVTELAKQMVAATVNLASSIASAWVNIPLMPTLGTWVGGGECDPVTGVCTNPVWRESEILIWFQQNNILGWWVGAFMVFGVMMVGVRMMLRPDGAQARELVTGLLTFAVIAGAGTATIQLLLAAGDQFSSYLLGRATGSGGDDEATFGDGIAAVLYLPAEVNDAAVMDSFWLGNSAVGLIIAILLLLFSILVFVLQLVVLVVRGALLLIMVILLPAAAALAMTETGKRMLSKYLGWVLALILYKPAAAILYAIAFRLGAEEENLLNVITGMAIFVLSLFMLPALLRLIVPATAAVASGAGMGGLAAAGAGAVGATGAIAVKSMMGPAGAAAAAGGSAASAAGGAASTAGAGGGAMAGSAGNTGPGGGAAPGGAGGGGLPGTGGGDSSSPGSGAAGPGGSGSPPGGGLPDQGQSDPVADPVGGPAGGASTETRSHGGDGGSAPPTHGEGDQSPGQRTPGSTGRGDPASMPPPTGPPVVPATGARDAAGATGTPTGGSGAGGAGPSGSGQAGAGVAPDASAGEQQTPAVSGPSGAGGASSRSPAAAGGGAGAAASATGPQGQTSERGGPRGSSGVAAAAQQGASYGQQVGRSAQDAVMGEDEGEGGPSGSSK